MALTPRQQAFADAYILHGNASRAYTEAGYGGTKSGVIRSASSKMLQNKKISAYIAERRQKLAKKADITAQRVIDEFAKIAFADPRSVMSWGPKGVELKPSSELTADEAALVAEASESVTLAGATRRVKLHDKLTALNALGKHLGLFADADIKIQVSLADLIVRSRKQKDGDE